jgi:hypothetical protein
LLRAGCAPGADRFPGRRSATAPHLEAPAVAMPVASEIAVADRPNDHMAFPRRHDVAAGGADVVLVGPTRVDPLDLVPVKRQLILDTLWREEAPQVTHRLGVLPRTGGSLATTSLAHVLVLPLVPVGRGARAAARALTGSFLS